MRATARPDPKPLRILGIDPGSRVTGYGLIEQRAGQLKFLDAGIIRTDRGEFQARLRALHAEAQSLFARTTPDECAIENVFVSKNAGSALKLGAARASVMCAGFSHLDHIAEYAPRLIKQAIAGTGAAEKEQVRQMVKMILGLGEKGLTLDASDALAIAICHAHSRAAQQHLSRARA